MRWAVAAGVVAIAIGASGDRPAEPMPEPGLIGVGIRFDEGVFIQEYWQGGVARYLLVNTRDEDVTITVLEWREGTALAGPWTVAAGAAKHVDADPLHGRDLLRFRLADGSALGLLPAPTAPEVASEAGRRICVLGMNGSGGMRRGVWTEHASLTYRPGEDVEIRLFVRPGWLFMLERQMPGLQVRSATAEVAATDDAFRIDLTRPPAEAAVHEVVIRFPAPDVTATTMVTVSPLLSTRPRGSMIRVSRGVVVAP